jgi:hypothetical protein
LILLTKTFKEVRLTNKNTGHSFRLNPKESAKFWYAKNANGEYINSKDDYSIEEESEINDIQFYLLTFALIGLSIASFILYIQWNY